MNDKTGWERDSFEYDISSGLIALYESNIIKNKNVMPKDRISIDDIKFLRKKGTYFPYDKIFDEKFADDCFKKVGNIDLLSDSVCLANNITEEKRPYLKNIGKAYHIFRNIKKINRLPKFWCGTGGGELYEFMRILAYENGGLHGEKSYFSFDNDINVCKFDGRELNDDEALDCIVPIMVCTLDKECGWSITAKEIDAKVTLGCTHNEIKSLLYAKSIPLSKTGRVRPVLHLVESHKRRIRNGIDIDITPYLRGVSEIEFNGTVFRINPPKILQHDLSKNSQKYFFE